MKQTRITPKNPVLPRQCPDGIGTRTRIYVSNKVVTANYNFSLLQERIFNFTIGFLQEHIDDVMNGRKEVQQLDIFREAHDVVISIPMKNIATAPQYEQVKAAARNLVGTVITMKQRGLHDIEKITFAGLYTAIEMDANRPTTIIAYMRQDVARHIIEVKRNASNRPYGYTGYILEVALNSKNKYTPRLYKLISSWKDKGGFEIPLDTLKEMLGVSGRYNDYCGFRHMVLMPAQQELKEHADCWFNMSDIVEVKQGKKVVALKFKVITTDFEGQRKLLLHNLHSIKNTFSLDTEQIETLHPIVENYHNQQELWQKIKYIACYIVENYEIHRAPGRVRAYAYTSLMNFFNQN